MAINILLNIFTLEFILHYKLSEICNHLTLTFHPLCFLDIKLTVR